MVPKDILPQKNGVFVKLWTFHINQFSNLKVLYFISLSTNLSVIIFRLILTSSSFLFRKDASEKASFDKNKYSTCCLISPSLLYLSAFDA